MDKFNNDNYFRDEMNNLFKTFGIKTMEDRFLEDEQNIKAYYEKNGVLPSKFSDDIYERKLGEIVEGVRNDLKITKRDFKVIQNRLVETGFNFVESIIDPLDDGEGNIWAPNNINCKFSITNGYIGLSTQHKHTIELILSLFNSPNITQFYLESYCSEFFFFKKPKNISIKECKRIIYSDVKGFQVDFHTNFEISSFIDYPFLRYHLPQIHLSETPEFDLKRWKYEYKIFQKRSEEWKL